MPATPASPSCTSIPALFPDLSVAENVFMGHMPRTALGAVDHAAAQARTRELLAAIGLECGPEVLLGRLRTSRAAAGRDRARPCRWGRAC